MTFINERTYAPVETPAKVAFLGLGVMGYPMAGHLASAGHTVTVYNRSVAKSQAWVAEFAKSKAPKSAPTSREAAAGADIVSVVTDITLNENPEDRLKGWVKATR